MKFKRFLSLLLALVMVLSMAACKGNEEDQQGDGGENADYTVSVMSAGGMALAGLDVYVYPAGDLTDMKGYAETDEEGNATISLPAGGDYAIVVSGAPVGYQIAESYSFTGTKAQITLTSSLVTDKELASASLGLGDVMYDFTVTSAQGEKVQLSEMLASKDMVLLNFWFSTCGPCANEFPYMEEAYQTYSDRVGVIALDPLEDSTTVATYQSSMSLTFPMAACPSTWANVFGITGYPTSIVIDRYGVICLMETGGLTSLTPFVSMFEYFSGDDYVQKLCTGGVSDIIVKRKPTTTMPTSEEIAAVISNGDIPVTYLNAGETDLEYNWPFILGEKDGTACIVSSNTGVENGYSIIRMQVELKAGQALGLDYIISSEANSDMFYVIVDDEPVNTISGHDEQSQWKSLYPCVADKDGTYTVSLCYIKDDSDDVGDDAVFIKNVRIISSDDIDTPTYLSRPAAVSEDGFTYSYVDLVYNESDGYYHVGEKNGPLLLANLMSTSDFDEENYIWGLVNASGLTIDGTDYTDAIQKFCSYASNSNLANYCTVTKELAVLLGYVDTLYGFDDNDDNEWLKACVYYKAFGSNGAQLEDPIAGLAPFCAYKATLGKNVATNYFYYNRMIMPRGLLAEFIPAKSGVYRITSSCDSVSAPNGWIFDENHNELYVYEADERMFSVTDEISLVYYMQAGKAYYIDIAFWDPYEEGTIKYDIEYLGSSIKLFRRCAQSYFTYDSDATGSTMYHLINGATIDIMLGSDGIYYQDLGNGKKGSKIYCDFTGTNGLFDTPVATTQAYDENGKLVYKDGKAVMITGMIDKGGFDFSKTEDDQFVLGYLRLNDNDPDKTREYLKDLWGEEYDNYAASYNLEEVLAGKYHGTGPDLTEEMRAYAKKIITTGSEELRGCVVVDERLAEILQLLMDKFTFANVDDSWVKMCYYYDSMG